VIKEKAIVFGITGQDGYYLSELLKNKAIEVIGVSRSSGDCKGDISEYAFVEALIKKNKPQYIFHLAAKSTTKHDALFENHQTICTGTLNVLESVKLHCESAKIFLSGSAMQFKNDGEPINEKSSFDGSSPYSVSRIQSIYAGRYYRNKFGLKVYVGYFFNHDSPLRSEQHVNQKIIMAAKKIAAGGKDKLEIGNVEVKKEFNFAGDVVEAIWILVNQNQVNEVIIGSGKAYSILEWAMYCFGKLNKKLEDFLILNENFKPEYNILVSDPTIIHQLGWQPKIDIYQLADLMLSKK
jgi:GDPmannose 4,6-dehydratase